LILFHPYHEEDQSDVLGSAITYQKRYEEVKESVALVRQRYEKYRAQVEEAAAAREDSAILFGYMSKGFKYFEKYHSP